jgi:hypothetical protein
MAFHVFDDGEQGANFVVAVVAIPVTITVVCLRVLSTVRAGKGVGLENWFALLALVAFLGYASLDLWSECVRGLSTRSPSSSVSNSHLHSHLHAQWHNCP